MRYYFLRLEFSATIAFRDASPAKRRRRFAQRRFAHFQTKGTKQMIRGKPHALASTPATPKRKNIPCFSYFRGGGFFLKWKGHFSFWGFALQVFRQCGRASMRTRQNGKIFSGERIFRFALADFPSAGGVWGMNACGLRLFVLAKFWRARKLNNALIFDIIILQVKTSNSIMLSIYGK